MKSILTMALTGILSLNLTAQTPEVPKVPATPESPSEDKPCNDDTTRLSFGKLKVIIFENDDDVQVIVDDNGDTTKWSEHDLKKQKKQAKFHSDWTGLSICANGALTYDNKITLPENMRFIEIDYGRSISAALNFADLELGFSPYVGLATGLGLQWNRYGIKNNYNITFNEDSLYGVANENVYHKNVLKATYITIPLLLEFHTNKKHSKSFNIALGVIGAYKLGSRLKQDYEFEGRNYEFKTKGHYHFSPFQAYATARIGYGDVSLFANYGLTRIFDEGRGPQLYPFQVGLHFNLD